MNALLRFVCVLVCVVGLLRAQEVSAQERQAWRACVLSASLQPAEMMGVDFDAAPNDDDRQRFVSLLERFYRAEKKALKCEWQPPSDEESSLWTLKIADADKKANFQGLILMNGETFATATLRPLTREEIKMYEEAFGIFVEGLCMDGFYELDHFKYVGKCCGQTGGITYFVVEMIPVKAT